MTDRPTVVFDLDGTLADTIRDLVGAMNRTVARHDVPPVAASDVAHLTGKGGLRAMITHVFGLEGRQLEPGQLDDLFAAAVREYEENIAVETVLYPGVLSSLERFVSEGWLLAICTNKPIAQTRVLLRELKLDTVFAAVSGADSFEVRKPDPRHLTRTIEIAGGAAERAIMVGDTATDILTARNAGIPVIAVDFGYSDVCVRTLEPDDVTGHFDDLYAKATALVG